MTVQTARSKVTDSVWQSPIEPSRYDRRPELDPAERAELARMTECLAARNPRGARRSAVALDRLIRPIQDVLAVTRAPTWTRYDVVNVLVWEMRWRQVAYWCWSQQVWNEVLARHKREERHARHHIIAVAFFLNGITDLHLRTRVYQYALSLAVKIFGPELVDASVARLCAELRGWGYSGLWLTQYVPRALASILLVNGSPRLDDLTIEVLQRVRAGTMAPYLKPTLTALSKGLASLGILQAPLPPDRPESQLAPDLGPGSAAPSEWDTWCVRWHATSALAPQTRKGVFLVVRRVGRWLRQAHPEVVSPDQWDRQLAAEYVAAVDRLTVGQWTQPSPRWAADPTRPISAGYKRQHLLNMSTFFRDLQEWGWIRRRFDPGRCFATPRSIRALIAPNPRVIQDDIWAKLLWAGMNLTADDLPNGLGIEQGRRAHAARRPWYPLEMFRAVVLVWLFAGIRRDELCRLRVGCVSWQRAAPQASGAQAGSSEAVCFLAIPTNKTSTAFTKPVDALVGEAIIAWERVRPAQPALVDRKTGERVHLLFTYRTRPIGQDYINSTVIPTLCRKAGVPERDARGRISSHRARSTIASQLYNAKEPLSLFELQAWLGHRSPASTQHYARITPTKLARAFADAGYFARNVRTIEVLIDQDAVRSGAAARGEPWRFYDLGHGLCTYEFFDQCPHRMACAKCAFYRPKGSSQAQLLEAKANLLRLRQDIPLTEDEAAAVDDGVEALDRLCAQLALVPTPAGPTPRELARGRPFPLPVLSSRVGPIASPVPPRHAEASED